MTREYVSGTYSNGGSFNGFFDFYFEKITAPGSIEAQNKIITLGYQFNTYKKYDNTTFSMQSIGENQYQLDISVQPESSYLPANFYNLSFKFSGMSPAAFDSESHQRSTIAYLNGSSRESTDIASSTISPNATSVFFTTDSRICRACSPRPSARRVPGTEVERFTWIAA